MLPECLDMCRCDIYHFGISSVAHTYTLKGKQNRKFGNKHIGGKPSYGEAIQKNIIVLMDMAIKFVKFGYW